MSAADLRPCPLSTSSFRPCCVIPIYDHGATIRALVAALATHGLPIYIVDDGSGEATRGRPEAHNPVPRPAM